MGKKIKLKGARFKVHKDFFDGCAANPEMFTSEDDYTIMGEYSEVFESSGRSLFFKNKYSGSVHELIKLSINLPSSIDFMGDFPASQMRVDLEFQLRNLDTGEIQKFKNEGPEFKTYKEMLKYQLSLTDLQVKIQKIKSGRKERKNGK